MKDLMVSKDDHPNKPAVKKVIFIVIAVSIVMIVVLNVINYFVS